MHTINFLRIFIFSIIALFFFQVDLLGQSFVMTPIGQNNMLKKPWDLHYGPDDYLWVTERKSGRVLRVHPVTGDKDELISLAPLVYSVAGQDGLLGMALHRNLLGDDPYVYLSYTYYSESSVLDRAQRLVRYTYRISDNNGSLSDPLVILEGLPASDDHNSGRLIFGPDEKLYYTIGDQGSNQGNNKCNPILSQVLPSQDEIDRENWSKYPGKILRINLDGSIPNDNPTIAGVQSHIYSFGHRNPQGLVFASNGLLYSDEHGPKTDDEVNIIYSGHNYGWPYVVGYLDDQAYEYCNWSSIEDCEMMSYSDACPSAAEQSEESDFSASNYQEPLLSMFAVPDDYDFGNPDCENSWMCRPNVAPSSLDVYESEIISGWRNSLLVTSLKRGRVYRIKLNESGTAIIGDTTEHFYTSNRYRDIAVDPDGKSFYVITDDGGKTSGSSGLTLADSLENPGTILKFTLEKTQSTNDLKSELFFDVWPNPASKKLCIALRESDKGKVRADLIHISGQTVKKSIALKSRYNEIDIRNFAKGAYLLKLYSEDESYCQRVIIH